MAESSKINNSSNDTSNEEEVLKWELAKETLNKFINNQEEEALAIFQKHADDIHMYAGYFTAKVIDALMTLEEDKLTSAINILKEAEKFCKKENGWFGAIKSKVYATNNTAHHMESQVILADSYMLAAALIFMQQDLSGYFKGGWILRKAWKQYDDVYSDISKLYATIKEKDVQLNMTTENKGIDNVENVVISKAENEQISKVDNEEFNKIDNEEINEVDNEEVSKVDNEEISKEDNDEINKVNTEEVNKMDKENISKVDNEEVNKADNEEITKVHNEEIKKMEKENICKVKNTGATLKTNSNGYIENYAHTTLNNTFLPKQSSSCYENFDSLILNDCNDSTNSVSNSRSESPRNYFFMKKSASVNSALSKQIDRTRRLSSRFSSFGSNITLSYFTSTFNLFSADKYNGNANFNDDTVKRLMGAVSFGYGLLQLGISLLPPALVKITNILGFHGNRQGGLNNLMYARLSNDMRAPLATLALLWYHTIVRPFYAFDGHNVQAGVEIASQLIEESDALYENSALFLFFKGRVFRLNSNIEAALKAFQTAVDNSNQREVRLLSMHEIGWCQMIQLMFKEANNTFVTLKTISRWSRAFYTYVSAICAGAAQLDANALVLEFNEAVKCIPKGTQLDVFLCRRQNIFMKFEFNDKRNDLFYKMLIYELLYLWNTLPSCETIEKIIDDCQLAYEGDNSPMVGLSELIQASCYSLKKDSTNSIEILRRLIDERKDLPNNVNDAHVSAFANYELGLLLVKEPELKSEGLTCLKKVLTYKGYDFEQRLEVRVVSLIKRYQNEVQV